MTRLALQALRLKLLNKECNAEDDVLLIFHEFYLACFLLLYDLWVEGHKTIHDAGYVLKGMHAKEVHVK